MDVHVFARRIERLVVIIVDAGTDPPADLERRKSAPGLWTVGERTGTTGIYNLSSALSGVVKYTLLEAHPKTRGAYEECWAAVRKQCPDVAPPERPVEADFEAYVIDLNFRQIADEKARRRFMSMITSFFLPAPDVQALIEAGRKLLGEHPEFQRFLHLSQGLYG